LGSNPHFFEVYEAHKSINKTYAGLSLLILSSKLTICS
jgi:hypothetical protein